jgi:hypothetical protein
MQFFLQHLTRFIHRFHQPKPHFQAAPLRLFLLPFAALIVIKLSLIAPASAALQPCYGWDCEDERVTAPRAPTNASVPSSDADGSFTLTWTRSYGGASYYRIYESANQANFRLISTGNVSSSASSYSVTQRSAGSYRYRVKACGDTQCSAWSESSQVVNVDTQSVVLDALKNPLKIGDIKTDQLGRASQRFIGGTGEVVVNPQTGKIISVNLTSSKKAARLMRQLENSQQ